MWTGLAASRSVLMSIRGSLLSQTDCVKEHVVVKRKYLIAKRVVNGPVEFF